MNSSGSNSQSVDFNSTLAALNTDVSSLNPSTAVAAIDGWQRRLEQSGEAEVLPIANDLGELKRLLTTDPLNGKAIGAVLQRLGAQTIAANESGKHGVASVVHQLGLRLTQIGDMLVGKAGS
jgi:hypothetical protein